MNIFRKMNRRHPQWWEREFRANTGDYAAAVIGVMLVLFGIFGPVARGSL